MCNLYTVRKSAGEIANHFGIDDVPDLAIPDETKPGGPGIIVRGPPGRRAMQRLAWGFPRPQTDNAGQPLHPKPVNLVADLTNPMWDKMVPDPRYRCLIPVTAFAQPDGPRGSMTRTWFSVTDWPIFAWAGFCEHRAMGAGLCRHDDRQRGGGTAQPALPVIRVHGAGWKRSKT